MMCTSQNVNLFSVYNYYMFVLFQLSERHRIDSWKSLIIDLVNEKEHHKEVSHLTDGIIAYVKSDGVIWVKIKQSLAKDNLDLACKYVIEELHEMKTKGTTADGGDIIKHATDLLKKLQIEKGKLEEELKQEKKASVEMKMKLEMQLDEKDKLISILQTQCQDMGSKMDECTEELKKVRLQQKTTQEVLENCKEELQQTRKQRKEDAKKMGAMFEEFKKIKEEDRLKKHNKTTPRQPFALSVVQLPSCNVTPHGQNQKK